jgi:hypothetical protein
MFKWSRELFMPLSVMFPADDLVRELQSTAERQRQNESMAVLHGLRRPLEQHGRQREAPKHIRRFGSGGRIEQPWAISTKRKCRIG